MQIEDEDIFLAFNYSTNKEPEIDHKHENKTLDILQFIEALTRISEDYY